MQSARSIEQLRRTPRIVIFCIYPEQNSIHDETESALLLKYRNAASRKAHGNVFSRIRKRSKLIQFLVIVHESNGYVDILFTETSGSSLVDRLDFILDYSA